MNMDAFPSLFEASASEARLHPDPLLKAISQLAEGTTRISVVLYLNGYAITGTPCSFKEWADASIANLSLPEELHPSISSFFDTFAPARLTDDLSEQGADLPAQEKAEWIRAQHHPYIYFNDASITGPGNSRITDAVVRVRLSEVSSWQTPKVTRPAPNSNES